MLRERFGCFLHDFGKQSCFIFIAAASGLCRPWKTTFRWLSGLGYSAFFLESAALVWENGAGLKIRGTVTQSMESNLGWKFLAFDLLDGP